MQDFSIFDSFAKGAKTSLQVRGTNCVIYTRVSSKEQADNLSLATQLKGCNAYAKKAGYNILSNFGGTYESAETDERKEFTAMISFVKKTKEKVSYILVYSLERFSRNDNSIWLSGELRKLGIEIVSVTQPIDTSNASGQMQQKMLFLFGEFDNQLRKQKCMAGVKEMLLRGDWPTMAPLGFDIVRVNNKRKIVVNAKGKLIKKAFEWKAFEGISNETIRARLAEKGLKLHHQRITEIFRNPFYCGLMAHNMLEGKVIDGNHEKMVSKDIFLKVNGLLDRNTQGYSINEENPDIPLKRFVCCDHCGKPLRGYMVKKKKIYYYKCSTVACGNNKSARDLNSTFEMILSRFKMDDCVELVKLLKAQTIATFNQLMQGQKDDEQVLLKQYEELKKKINRLEERYIEEEINGELYNKFFAKYSDERKEIEDNLKKLPQGVSNLDECIQTGFDFLSKAQEMWKLGDYNCKQAVQYLLFPEGIRYSKKNDGCRTTRVNSVFAFIIGKMQDFRQEKSGIPELNLGYAALVARSGIEPETFGL
jgi:site-specific DNA recombinase